MSFQATVENHTPFSVERFVLLTPEAQEATLIVLVASFVADPSGRLVVDIDQDPIRVGDDYWGLPGNSSLVSENHIALSKSNVDVVVRGRAIAPQGRPVSSLFAELHVGDIHKVLKVSGSRTRIGGALGEPQPFSQMPIVYERAFGGVCLDTGEAFPENPVGVGFNGAKSRETGAGDVPNVEYLDSLVEDGYGRPAPAGFGPIAKAWKPRAGLVGTMDEHWLRNRWPLLPENFDMGFFQCAPLDQRSKTIIGGEQVRLVNLTENGVWQFQLPRLTIPVRLWYRERDCEAHLKLDTIEVEPDDLRLRMIARLCPTSTRRDPLLAVTVGNMTRSWVRARAQRKTYLDFAGSGGVDKSLPLVS